MSKKILCIIPARKNSKGIKNKNLYKVNNKPLIYYTLKQAVEIQKKIDIYIHISTDNKKILSYAKQEFNISCDYLRPKIISGDKSSMVSTVLHSLNWLKKKKLNFDSVLLLQPTNPVRLSKEILKAISIFKKKNLISLMSVTNVREHPYEIVNIKNKKWKYLIKRNFKYVARQFFDKNYYFIDGSIYLSKVSFLKKYKNFVIKDKTKLFFLNRSRPIDIDYYDDLPIAEFFLKKFNIK